MPAAQTPEDDNRRYVGSEKREYPRIPASYPICVRFRSRSGRRVERFAKTKNVSTEGLLFSCADSLDIGTEVARRSLDGSDPGRPAQNHN